MPIFASKYAKRMPTQLRGPLPWSGRPLYAQSRTLKAESDLKIVRLAMGRRPSDDTDCVKIEEKSDGRFALTGTVLCQNGGAAESVSLMETATFEDRAKAEEAGFVWANAQGVQLLYVAFGSLDRPIAQSEIDEPL